MSTTKRRRGDSLPARIGFSLGLPVLLVAIWWLSTAVSPSFFVPTPPELAQTFWETWVGPRFHTDLLPSLVRLAVGIVATIVLGVTLGVLIGANRTLRSLTEPTFEFFRAVPPPVLVPLLILLILIDVAIRRIAWDWAATKQFAGRGAEFLRGFTATRKVETTGSIDALRDVRSGRRAAPTPRVDAPPARDPSRKFEAKESVKGSLSDVVGGATDKPTPQSRPTGQPPKGQQGDKPGTGGGMSGLLDAKRKAQEEIKRREEGEK